MPHPDLFFFNDTAPPEIYTLSLHDALPIWRRGARRERVVRAVRAVLIAGRRAARCAARGGADRKSTRLNSSHVSISYAVFCLKKKKKASSARYENQEMSHSRFEFSALVVLS